MMLEKGKLYKLAIVSTNEENLIGLYLGTQQDFMILPEFEDFPYFNPENKLPKKCAHTFLINKEISWVFEDEILEEII